MSNTPPTGAKMSNTPPTGAKRSHEQMVGANSVEEEEVPPKKPRLKLLVRTLITHY